MPPPKVTHERFVPGAFNAATESEHLARYRFAATFATDARIVDAATGSGYGALMLAQAGAKSVIGVDISEEAIRDASSECLSDRVRYQVSDVSDLSWIESETIDLAISYETIEHLRNPVQFMAELQRIIKKGGRCIISTPDRRLASPLHFIEGRPRNRYHMHEYDKGSFTSLFVKYFRVESVYGQQFVPAIFVSPVVQMPIKAGARLKIPFVGRLKAKLYDGRNHDVVKGANGDIASYWVLVGVK